MKKIFWVVVIGLLLSSNVFAESKKVKTWKNRQIPEEYKNPNLETLQYHFLTYNIRGLSNQFYTKPSSQPTALKFNLQKELKIIKKIVNQMQSTGLISYLMLSLIHI